MTFMILMTIMTKKPLCRSQLPILALPLKLILGTDPVVDYSLDDLDLGTGVYDPDPVDETPISVFDADMLSQVTRGLGTSTTLGEDNPQLALNADPNSRFDFDPVGAYETETIGALPVDIVAVLGFRQFQSHALITWLWVHHQLSLL
jgi:hypothetical protein